MAKVITPQAGGDFVLGCLPHFGGCDYPPGAAVAGEPFGFVRLFEFGSHIRRGHFDFVADQVHAARLVQVDGEQVALSTVAVAAGSS